MQVVVAHSEDVDTSAALGEVVERARAALRPEFGPPRALIVFATYEYDHAALVNGVRAAFPDLPLVGGTVDAISSGRLGYHEDAIALVVLCGERLTARTGVARGLSSDARGASATVAAAVADALSGLDSPRLCISLGESLAVNGAEVLEGLVAGVGEGVGVVGGTATDGQRYGRVFQFCDGEVVTDAAAFLLLAGDIDAGWCAECGWDPVGVEGVVTDVEGPVLRRVGDESALAFYQRYLGEGMAPNADNPIAVFEPQSSEVFYLRAPLSIDEATGAVTFFAPIPEGATVCVTETSREEILDAARRSAERARSGLSGSPQAALFFSCVGRKNQLGTRTSLELDRVRAVTGEDCPTLGVYTYGEFGAVTPQGPSRFLNQSLVTLLLGDR